MGYSVIVKLSVVAEVDGGESTLEGPTKETPGGWTPPGVHGPARYGSPPDVTVPAQFYRGHGEPSFERKVVVTITRRTPIFWPSALRQYQSCAERYYHQYVARTPREAEFNRALLVGVAVHGLLADCHDEFRRTRSVSIGLATRAGALLPLDRYPALESASRLEDIVSVVDAAKWVLSRLDGRSNVLGVEQVLSYPFAGSADTPAFVLRAKVDLILEHPQDGTLEHIDFRTGKVRADAVQEAAEQIVVGQAYGARYPTIRSTILYVTERQAVTVDLDRSACQQGWRDIQTLVRSIMADDRWSPNPSALCSWCPYADMCSANQTGVGWLDIAD